MRRPYLSFVYPIFNEEDNLSLLVKRTLAVTASLKKSWEIIFVNDGSRDRSYEILNKLSDRDKRIKVLHFSRNFGHQTAVSAGIEASAGQYVAVLDADLQDPPEIIPKFIAKMTKGGYNVAYAVRKTRKENFLKKAAYRTFYRLLKKIAAIDIPLDAGDFCVMERSVVDTLVSLPERNRFVRGLRGWVGFNQIGIEYDRDKRHAGKTKYSLKKLFKLAFDGFVGFSYIPLRIWAIFGFAASAISFLGVLLVLYLRLFTDTTVPGFATTVIVLLFFGGVQLTGLGIIGEYIGRIYDEVKARPLYIVKEKRNL